MLTFLLWLILLLLCWPLALLALLLYPLVWLILLPFRLVGVAVGGVLSLLWAVVTLPADILRRLAAGRAAGAAVLCLFVFSGAASAEVPAGLAQENEKTMKLQAAVEFVVKVSSITGFKDGTLVYGGYSCLNGTVLSVRLNRRNAKGQDLKLARKAGDKVSILLDCQPDNVPFGPGQVRTELCSKARKARLVKVWSGLINFPLPPVKGCERADSGFEIIR